MEIDAEALEVLKHRAKAHLRKQARAVRGAMSRAAVAERSAAIAERLAALPLLRDAKTVALFHPMDGKNEVDLRRLDEVLRGRGTRVAYPALESNDGGDTPVADARPSPPTMVFRLVDDPSRMEERGNGFSEPRASDPLADRVDVVVVPALAVDTRGHRIGYGAGFYDRTLPSYAPPARTVVVAFDFQLVAEVPAADRDIACDWVVTDQRAIDTHETDSSTDRSSADGHVPRMR